MNHCQCQDNTNDYNEHANTDPNADAIEYDNEQANTSKNTNDEHATAPAQRRLIMIRRTR